MIGQKVLEDIDVDRGEDLKQRWVICDGVANDLVLEFGRRRTRKRRGCQGPVGRSER